MGSRLGFLLSYPRFDGEVAESRLRELHGLGVEALVSGGRHVVDGVPILGKGHVGVVVAALLGGVGVAVKIRRVDADRSSLAAEAENLRIANKASVGPEFLGASQNFLVMELVEGDYLAEWVAGLEPSEGGRAQGVLRRLLWKARRLDTIGLDHGELSRAHRHVIVSGGEPRIVDFESASTGRRCGNVTSVAQYLFFSRRMAGLIGGIHPMPGREVLIEALRGYKKEPTDEGFRRVLAVCGLSA